MFYYVLSFTVTNTGTTIQYLYANRSCGCAYPGRWYIPTGVVTSLAPGQTTTLSVEIGVPSVPLGDDPGVARRRGRLVTGLVQLLLRPAGLPTTYQRVGSRGTGSASRSPSRTGWRPPGRPLMDFRPTVTPKAATETVPFAATLARSFTITNAGTRSATYSISAICGA